MKVEDKESVEQNEEKMTAVDQQEREQEPADRATTTRELAKDLERTPSGRPTIPRPRLCSQRMSHGTFTNVGRTFKRRSWTSRDTRLSRRMSWLQK